MTSTFFGPGADNNPIGGGEITDITVTAAANSVIQTIASPPEATSILVTIKNSHSSVAFDQFDVSRRATINAPWEVVADAAGNFTVPQPPLNQVSGAPVTLAAAASTHLKIDLSGTQSVRFRASGNGAATTAEIYWRFA